MYEGEITKEFKQKFNEYYKHFGENFPTMCYDGDDIVEFMDKCIKKNKPYEPKYEDDEES